VTISHKRTTVEQIAREAGLDADDALVTLWDAGFPDLADSSDRLQPQEANRARRILGVATRRELDTPEHWQAKFGISREHLDSALKSLGVAKPYDGQRLSRKAINRLRAELRASPKSLARPELTAQSPPSVEWELVGHACDLQMLTEAEVLAIHEALVEDFRRAEDPIEPAGLRSPDLLSSAVMRPATAIGDEQKYPTVEMAAAALFHSVIHNHPFHNGNKRTALVSLLVFLDENGMMLTCEEDELFKHVLQVAQHSLVDSALPSLPDRETLAIAKWIKARVRWVEKGDRAITWRRLEQLLTTHGCTYRRYGRTVTFTRSVTQRIRFLPWMTKHRTLTAQASFAGYGREVQKSMIAKLRRDLELDEEHGVDSQAFYDDASVSTSDFIARYRKTLARLARL
jgi:death-on-curing family protein